MEKGQKAGYLQIITLNEWKGNERKKIEENQKRGKRKKAMVVLLAFTLASLEISFWPTKKNCLTEEVYYFGGNVKTPLDIEAR